MSARYSAAGGHVSNYLRSEDMSLVQLYIPSELAHPVVSELGELGQIQFRDLNPEVNSFQRTFVGEIRRLDDMDRKIRFLVTQCEKSGIVIKPAASTASYVRPRTVQELDDLQTKVVDIEKRLQQMNASQEVLNKRYFELTEMRHVLREAAYFFEEAEMRSDTLSQTEDPDAPLLFPADVEAGTAGTGSRSVSLSFVAGIIPRTRMITFERILWRVLRGNLYMNYAEVDEPIVDPVTDEAVLKNVFVVFAHGTEVLAKIRKISESLGATVYPVDGTSAKRVEDTLEVAARIEDLNNVLFNTKATKRAELLKIADIVDQWVVFVKKEKAIYHSMNLFNFDLTRKCLIAEGWCPSNSISAIQYALHAVCERSGSMVPPVLNELQTHRQPPTYHKTNKFTRAFQEIVDAYGVARYKEVNPALFSIVTFPFLFAVMFGDFGHGIMMTLSAIYLVVNEKKLASIKDEIFKMLYGGRYIVLLMGIFSVYVGVIYNDLFSVPMFLGSSGWTFQNVTYVNTTSKVTHYQVDAIPTHTYPIGVDPRWHMSENSLIFLNSYKMKMSIIMGVAQMCFGITLTAFNHRYFKKPMNILFETIPQLLFMFSIFGYLCFLIIFKWLTDWRAAPDRSPPGLLNTLIYMFLKFGSVDEKDQLYAGQGGIQAVLVVMALLCVPWMLCAKPWYLARQHRKNSDDGYATVHGTSPSEAGDASQVTSPAAVDVADAGEHGGDGHGDGKFNMGDIVVHQVIHTIEFCLGGISNTASYLRLWALSLAHAQLSEVLWQMTVKTTLNMTYAIIIGYAAWFSLTIGILLVMEGLSAFLHALRLHWVEFNGKFYEGSGTKFEPFSFQAVLDDESE